MVQIIQEKNIKGPSFSQKFSNAVGVGLEGAGQLYKEHQANKLAKENEAGENETVKRLTGQDISGIKDPKIRQQVVQDLMKGQAHQQQAQMQQQEKLSPFQAGLQTIEAMRQIPKEDLGVGSGFKAFFGGPNASNARAKYSQLGKSLIQLASTIPIRNKAEFETLAANLHDPSLMDAEREGILDAMEQIIKQNMQQHMGSFSGEMQREAPQKQERPPLSSFKR